MESGPSWQSIKINFPKKLYLYAVWIKGRSLIPYFTNVLHKSFSAMIKNAVKQVQYYADNVEGAEYVSRVILAMPLDYVKDYPLKKSFWEYEPQIKLDESKRLLEFIYAVDKPELYYTCATPSVEIDKGKITELKFGAAFPILKSREEDIDNLMRASNFPVTPEAKNCAIYRIGKVYGYDLEEGKKIKRKNIIKPEQVN